jgi:HK97 family phage prohead protease
MSNKFHTKNYGEIMSDVDRDTRKVKAVVAVFNNVDLDNDIIIPEAVTKTIRERGPMGKNLIWNLIDHKANMKSVLGKPSELYVEGDKLMSVTPIVETELGEDYIKLCEAGVVNQYSIGFSTIKSNMREDGVRVISELRLYEYSAVLWGANPETSFVGIKSEINDGENAEDLIKRLEKLTVAFKNGTFTDDTFGLLEIEIKQIQDAIAKLSTPPAVKAVEPQVEDSSLLDAIRNTNSQLKNLLK